MANKALELLGKEIGMLQMKNGDFHLLQGAYVLTASGNDAILSMSHRKQDLTHHPPCSGRSKMLHDDVRTLGRRALSAVESVAAKAVGGFRPARRGALCSRFHSTRKRPLSLSQTARGT